MHVLVVTLPTAGHENDGESFLLDSDKNLTCAKFVKQVW